MGPLVRRVASCGGTKPGCRSPLAPGTVTRRTCEIGPWSLRLATSALGKYRPSSAAFFAYLVPRTEPAQQVSHVIKGAAALGSGCEVFNVQLRPRRMIIGIVVGVV